MLADQLFSRLVGRTRLKHLQLVVDIAELQSLQKAALAVGLSQPAATQALAEFESVLGAPLFERHARGMRPSELGIALLPMMRMALQQMQVCANTVIALQGGTRVLVRIAAISAAVSGWLTVALPPFVTAHPDIALDIQEVTADDILRLVEHDIADLLLCREPTSLPTSHGFTPVLEDRFVVVARVDHPLAALDGVSDLLLAAQTWITPPLTGITPREFAELFARLGGTPTTCQMSTRSVMLANALLSQSDMLALTPYNLIRPLLEEGRIAVLRTRDIVLAPLGYVVRHGVEAQTSSALARTIRGLQEWAPS
ncbi:LysR family transcriptional regulator [Variovorax paradoxus]|uniref:LysR substrate-binding domain-containing protein n=1 Tax=Variovorax paradoxus TaxID=34073 RepID=UPI00278285D1|nr:LysR family transcriptional regulator [Variovorax paradoxus]MDP9932818.1 DNA-binding transcriptional LysR family regulator [Variovorax paradoxus]